MNPLTQQHISHISLSGRGQVNVEGWREVFTRKELKGKIVNLKNRWGSYRGGRERSAQRELDGGHCARLKLMLVLTFEQKATDQWTGL